MTAGQNSVSSEHLRNYVDQVERIRAEKKQLGMDESAVLAEAKSAGFTPRAIVACVKIRAMKPHDFAESEALRDMYLSALGMAQEPPLFRYMSVAGFDATAREAVLARMKDFVPAHGSGDITVNMGGKPVRLSRAKDNSVVVTEIVEAPEPRRAESPAPRREKPEVPDVDADGAEELGREYARDNRPVIDNPFPFGDARRARFDLGWRKETGNDGMGPGGDE